MSWVNSVLRQFLTNGPPIPDMQDDSLIRQTCSLKDISFNKKEEVYQSLISEFSIAFLET